MAFPLGRCSKNKKQPSCASPVHSFWCSAPSVGMSSLRFSTPRGCGAHLLSPWPLARVSGTSHFATPPLRELQFCSRCLQNQWKLNSLHAWMHMTIHLARAGVAARCFRVHSMRALSTRVPANPSCTSAMRSRGCALAFAPRALPRHTGIHPCAFSLNG